MVVCGIGSREFTGHRHRGRHSCCFFLRKGSQAAQHLEQEIWQRLYGYREFHKQVRGTFMKGIIDQLLPRCFICSA